MGGFDEDGEDDFDKMARADRLKAQKQQGEQKQEHPNDATGDSTSSNNNNNGGGKGNGEITEVKSTQPAPAPGMNIGGVGGEPPAQPSILDSPAPAKTVS